LSNQLSPSSKLFPELSLPASNKLGCWACSLGSDHCSSHCTAAGERQTGTSGLGRLGLTAKNCLKISPKNIPNSKKAAAVDPKQ